MRRAVDKRDVSFVADQYLCNSCGACLVSCPHEAIQYRETSGGYLFPEVDRNKCTSCGLCYQVCPGAGFSRTLCEQLPQDPFVGDILTCEVGRATDEKIFVNSQSGGVTTALLKSLFDSGKIDAAIVATMKIGVPPRGAVLVARNSAELIQAQKSKYTPIPLLRALCDVQAIKGSVALVGLPCHIHGLYNLLDTFPALANLDIYKVGLFCDRVMLSTGIDFMAGKATGEAVENFTFRDKQHDSYPGNPIAYKVGGEKVVLGASLRMAMKDFFTPARCRLCFDKLNVFADVVCGDPHGIEGVDRHNGETLIIGRTQRGNVIIEQAKINKAVELRPVCPGIAVSGQGITKKRREWAAYMTAWDAMGKNSPSYPFESKNQSDVIEYKRQLEHALCVDGYESPSALMKAANRWLANQKFRKLASLPSRALRAFVRKANKRGCK